MKIFKIAVTGSAGSGKSLVCKRFEHHGLHTLDCDVIARQVVEPGEKAFKQIVELFGPAVVQKGGFLDRSRLRQIIVDDPELRKKMEAVVHPQVLEKMVFQMEQADYEGKIKACAVEVPLLFETGMEKHFDLSIAVIADDTALLKRVSQRDNVAEKNVQKMLDAQMTQKEKEKRADYIIKNTGTNTELFESVDNLFHKIQKEFLTI